MNIGYTPIHLRTGMPLTDDRLNAMLNSWPGYGIIHGTQRADAPSPRTSRRDLAVMLCQHEYSLSDELSALLPEPDAVPDDAVA